MGPSIWVYNMSSDETALPQVGLNPTAATLLVESWVSGANGSMDSGGSHSLGMSQVQCGESNARGNKPGSKTQDSEEAGLLQVDSSSIQRSGSQSSLLSVQSAGSYGSAVSVFSNDSANAAKACNRHWVEIVELRLEQARNIDLITAKLEDTTKSCNVQKNVNMTIKEGLKKIVDAIDRDHNAARRMKESYRHLQEMAEELRDRRKTRERLQA